jgi:hypothetical protein
MEKTIAYIGHNTPYKEYRRAGLVLTQESQPYEITAEQMEILQNDPRIEMHEVLTPKNADRLLNQGK